ncbi:hypothetical protein GCK72_018185 [Caenorhabditis remanei]|uniref:Uncharacterized protein n=1 Tax=Caenorhabditis remanei TaxID=31234 RepID=A0A6A5GA39_CAERE|nr:hypothetical protein GCK72_018185 [Caenorhabditis remanei]KAF1751631.1 hypothetical protein GCK72_018185 [Caenorhabditis remanei]
MSNEPSTSESIITLPDIIVSYLNRIKDKFCCSLTTKNPAHLDLKYYTSKKTRMFSLQSAKSVGIRLSFTTTTWHLVMAAKRSFEGLLLLERL